MTYIKNQNFSYVYTGPSWAASSYPIGLDSTNLAKEWGFQYVDYSRPGSTVLDCIESVKAGPLRPLVWVYHEPLKCLHEATGMTTAQFIESKNWKDIWQQCNQFCLDLINSLNRPVLLIGAHSDVLNCNYSNITVAHSSWQKFLAEAAGMSIVDDRVFVKMDDGGDFYIDFCWGAEVIHQFIHEHPDIVPSQELTNAIWDAFFFWKELEKTELFYEVHPSSKGTRIFAEFLKPIVKDFLKVQNVLL